MGLDFLRNINAKVKLLLQIRNESTPISSIRAKLLNRRIPLIRSLGSKYPSLCVMNVGSMNYHRQQIPHGIHYDVPFSAFRFFPPSIPRSSLAATVFTL